ncbi:hypothetical protein D4R08_05540 [Corynebacterium xerosis]|nr:hypothetical protein D4R08_05540 [Corynebacterium xerosis]
MLPDGWAYAQHYDAEQQRKGALGWWLHDLNHCRRRSVCEKELQCCEHRSHQYDKSSSHR